MTKKINRKSSDIRGEWWIQDGQAIYADGDYGDTNHEMYVIDSIRRDVISSLGSHTELEFVDDDSWYEIKKQIVKEKVRSNEIDEEELIEKFGHGYLEDIDYSSEDAFTYICNKEGVDKEELSAANNEVDLRTFGMKQYGWKRVDLQYVQTWTLTSSDLRQIADGLYDAYNIEEDEEDQILFNIEVMATRKTYTNIPYSVIAGGRPMEVVHYGGEYSPYAYARNWYKKYKVAKLVNAMQEGQIIELNTRKDLVFLNVDNPIDEKQIKYYEDQIKKGMPITPVNVVYIRVEPTILHELGVSDLKALGPHAKRGDWIFVATNGHHRTLAHHNLGKALQAKVIRIL